MISWTTPDDNGATITAYRIVIKQMGSTTYTENVEYCDGSNSVIFNNQYCFIPMTTLSSYPYFI
jgi:hypothetical protein